MLKELFSSRAGFGLIDGQALCRADWPIGKLMLDKQALTLDALFVSYRIPLRDVSRIQSPIVSFRIEYHKEGLPKTIEVWGWRLFKRLRDAAGRNSISLEFVL